MIRSRHWPRLKRFCRNLLGKFSSAATGIFGSESRGKRAYDLARQGKEVNLQPRPIDVFSIVIQAYNYPTLTLDIRCGSGTYVRSLGRDLAEALGTAAVMSNLVRTEIGDFTLATAVSPDVLTTTNLAEHLLPADRAVQRPPRVTITSEEMIELGHGRSISLRGTETEEYAASSTTGKLVAVVGEGGALVADARLC